MDKYFGETLTVAALFGDTLRLSEATHDEGFQDGYWHFKREHIERIERIVARAKDTKKSLTETTTEHTTEKGTKMQKIEVIAKDIAEQNKGNLIIAGKVVAGQTVINRVRKLAESHIPKDGIIRKAWDSAFGDLIISNLLMLATRFYPDNAKLNALVDCTNLAAAISTKDKLNIQPFIESLLDGISLPGTEEVTEKAK
jgi:hypothetical protein